jgi:DNA-binding NarL/FixJ family response regulator
MTIFSQHASTIDAISVLLADDHAVLLESLALYLRQHANIQVVGQVRHGDLIAKAVVDLRPQVLVMDLSMPGADAYQRLQQIKRVSDGRVATLILSSDLGGYAITELLRAGARGYLPKDAEGLQLVAAIDALANGKIYLHADADALIQAMQLGPNHDLDQNAHDWHNKQNSQAAQRAIGQNSNQRSELSKRELQLLNLMSQGCSNKEISDRLFLSIGTIKSYSSRLFEKLQVRDRTQAVLFALQHSLLPKQH